MIKVCAGCHGDYPKNPDGSLLDLPFDLCVSHEENITLTNPNNKKKPFMKKTKSHYPPTPSCIVLKYPTFQLASLVVPLKIQPRLASHHWHYLRLNFGVYPPSDTNDRE